MAHHHVKVASHPARRISNMNVEICNEEQRCKHVKDHKPGAIVSRPSESKLWLVTSEHTIVDLQSGLISTAESATTTFLDVTEQFKLTNA